MSKREKKNEAWAKIKKDQAKISEETHRENEGRPRPGQTNGRLPSGRIPGR